jgi:acyl-CoA dehydrogenase
MRRTIFSEEHDLFRSEFRRFAEAEIVPNLEAWNDAGISDRAAWKKMGESGFLGANQPEEYGGAGADFLFDAILPYLTTFATEEQKQRWLVPAIAGDCLVAIAMTEPSVGSDLAGI